MTEKPSAIIPKTINRPGSKLPTLPLTELNTTVGLNSPTMRQRLVTKLSVINQHQRHNERERCTTDVLKHALI